MKIPSWRGYGHRDLDPDEAFAFLDGTRYRDQGFWAQDTDMVLCAKIRQDKRLWLAVKHLARTRSGTYGPVFVDAWCTHSRNAERLTLQPSPDGAPLVAGDVEPARTAEGVPGEPYRDAHRLSQVHRLSGRHHLDCSPEFQRQNLFDADPGLSTSAAAASFASNSYTPARVLFIDTGNPWSLLHAPKFAPDLPGDGHYPRHPLPQKRPQDSSMSPPGMPFRRIYLMWSFSIVLAAPRQALVKGKDDFLQQALDTLSAGGGSWASRRGPGKHQQNPPWRTEGGTRKLNEGTSSMKSAM